MTHCVDAIIASTPTHYTLDANGLSSGHDDYLAALVYRFGAIKFFIIFVYTRA